MMSELDVLAAERSGADTATVKPRGRHLPGGRWFVVTLRGVDRRVLGDDRWVGSEAGEALDEGSQPLCRRIQHAVHALWVVESVAERAIGVGIAPVGPRPWIRASTEPKHHGRIRRVSPADFERVRRGEHGRPDLGEVAFTQQTSR